MLGGLAYNMKFPKSLLAQPEARNALRDLILTYLDRGGFQTQINVVDRETLLAARENPQQYRDLVVRIGGYTDYFTRLNPGMQEEIIARAEMGL
jgi:formate C-acetyltransferase